MGYNRTNTFEFEGEEIYVRFYRRLYEKDSGSIYYIYNMAGLTACVIDNTSIKKISVQDKTEKLYDDIVVENILNMLI